MLDPSKAENVRYGATEALMKYVDFPNRTTKSFPSGSISGIRMNLNGADLICK